MVVLILIVNQLYAQEVFRDSYDKEADFRYIVTTKTDFDTDYLVKCRITYTSTGELETFRLDVNTEEEESILYNHASNTLFLIFKDGEKLKLIRNNKRDSFGDYKVSFYMFSDKAQSEVEQNYYLEKITTSDLDGFEFVSIRDKKEYKVKEFNKDLLKRHVESIKNALEKSE